MSNSEEAASNIFRTHNREHDRQQLGDALIADGEFDAALKAYKAAVHLNGSNVRGRMRLGDAYAYADDSLQAHRQYAQAIKLSPRRAEPHFSMAELLTRYSKF